MSKGGCAFEFAGVSTQALRDFVVDADIPPNHRILILLEIVRRQQEQIDNLVAKLDLIAQGVKRG